MSVNFGSSERRKSLWRALLVGHDFDVFDDSEEQIRAIILENAVENDL